MAGLLRPCGDNHLKFYEQAGRRLRCGGAGLMGDLPAFNYAAYAQMPGLDGVRIVCNNFNMKYLLKDL